VIPPSEPAAPPEPSRWWRGVWRSPAFVRLWGASVVSGVGTSVSALALPLVAAFTLDATPFQMGLLAAVGTVPLLVLGLLAGVWVDRHARRPIMIVTDLGRAALLLLIPLAAWLGVLRFEHLLVVSLLVGALSVFFDVASQSFLPTILRNDQLAEGNARLYTGYGIAEVGGPGLAGWFTQIFSAPAVLLVDAVSYVVSALLLGSIRAIEPPPLSHVDGAPPHFWQELMEGLRIVARNPMLRATALATGVWNLFEGARQGMFVLFLARTLGLPAGAIGAVYTVAAAGFLIGSLFPERVARRIGLGRAITFGLLATVPGDVLASAATGPPAVAAGMAGAGMFLAGLTAPTYDVNQFSLRQAVTPLRLQGRVNATMRTIIRGVLPLGALLGGLLAEPLGLRGVIWFGLLGPPAAFLAIWFSPVRTLVVPPQRIDEA
jgi:MFS family permease